MVAPIDAKVVYEAGDEKITLRLNFRSISLLEENGLDLFTENGVKMTLARSATMLKCLSINDHPEMTDDEALAAVVKGKSEFGMAVIELLAKFGGKEDEGNVKAAKAA